MWNGGGFIPIIIYGGIASAGAPSIPLNSFLLMDNTLFKLMDGTQLLLMGIS
jgi:hypothetical protein